MILHLYIVHDGPADAFLPPFIERSDGAAIRSFSQALGTPNHRFAANPADYTLFRAASFDDNSGFIAPLSQLANLGNGLSLLPGTTLSTTPSRNKNMPDA